MNPHKVGSREQAGGTLKWVGLGDCTALAGWLLCSMAARLHLRSVIKSVCKKQKAMTLGIFSRNPLILETLQMSKAALMAKLNHGGLSTAVPLTVRNPGTNCSFSKYFRVPFHSTDSSLNS